MTNKGKKLEPPLKLDMDFGEALRRFVATSPKEVEELIEQSKQRKPLRDDAPQRSERGRPTRKDRTGSGDPSS